MTEAKRYNAGRRARTALANAQTRAEKKISKGDFAGANRTLIAGMLTALSWLDGSHPKLRTEQVLAGDKTVVAELQARVSG
jgi:hypothetical protein